MIRFPLIEPSFREKLLIKKKKKKRQNLRLIVSLIDEFRRLEGQFLFISVKVPT